jgi:GNAT superfamily N-acetyltransferase
MARLCDAWSGAMTSTIALRKMADGDVPAVAALCGQLGYPSSEADVAARWRQLASQTRDRVLVAVIGGAVVGWIHLHVWVGLESGPDIEIGGLVVDEQHRGAGVGRLLMKEAEDWARHQGCRRIRLRSNVVRTAAHAFYQRIGYRVFKTQYAFEKATEGTE